MGVDAASLLFELGLGEKVDVAGKWCYEMGAESLGDDGVGLFFCSPRSCFGQPLLRICRCAPSFFVF